jgi:hypothetical protein
MKRLGFGCGSVMGRVGRRASLLAMNAAWDAAVTLFDNARSYGYGEAETLLGEFLAGRRQQATIVTKFGIVPRPQPLWRRAAKPFVRAALSAVPDLRSTVRRRLTNDLPEPVFDVRTLQASLEQSLRALQTDYVDVLLAHEAPASIMAQDDLMAALEQLIRSGKVLRAGLSGSQSVAAEVMTHGPAVLSVVQFPAPWHSGVPLRLLQHRDHLRIANHTFGGPVQAAALRSRLTVTRDDPSTDDDLREKLQGDLDVRLAEVVFGSASVDCVVASMLQPAHIRANVEAISSVRFTATELARLQGAQPAAE